jgi:hypothetical protein
VTLLPNVPSVRHDPGANPDPMVRDSPIRGRRSLRRLAGPKFKGRCMSFIVDQLTLLFILSSTLVGAGALPVSTGALRAGFFWLLTYCYPMAEKNHEHNDQ